MNRALPAVAGLLLAVTVVLLFLAWREIGDLREEVAQLRNEREARKMQPFSVREAALAGTGSKKSPDKKPEDSAGDKEDEKEGASGMELLLGAGKAQLAKRQGARLSLLTQRLNLRPEQLKTLEKRAEKYSEEVAATFKRMENEKARPPDLGVLIDWTSGRFNVPVKDLLDTEQAKLFSGFDAEDRANRIENLVNMELSELHGQGTINLTPEQKDKAFEALTAITTTEDAMGDAYYFDDAGYAGRIEDSLARRREALKAIFDATQLENYDRVLQEDRETIFKTFPPSQSSPPPVK
jgi:hypothetical protein